MQNYIVEAYDKKWSEIISKCSIYDFYHTQAFHLLEQHSTPKLFVVEDEDKLIAFPLLVRSIQGTEYNDCTSVYGYSGPVSTHTFSELPARMVLDFHEFINEFFRDYKIVSVFSRLHPLIKYYSFFEGHGEVVELNKTVAIDLTLAAADQRSKYRKSNRSEINQLRRRGFEVRIAKTRPEIDEFVDIYHNTMRRVGASEYYYFSYDYFYSLLNSNCFRSELLLAIKDGVLAAGALFTITKGIMQYHLAGTKEGFMREAPMKLIIDEARILGNSLNLSVLHLGGGVGGADTDSLFRFKSGFSDRQYQFKVWKYIVDQSAYDNLVKEAQVKDSSLTNYFPLYRAEI